MSERREAATTLPQDLVDALQCAYQEYREASPRSQQHREKARFLAYFLAAGYKQGWPVRVMAEPCGVSPERLRQIIREWKPKRGGRPPKNLPTFPAYIAPERPRTRRPRKRPQLTDAQKNELRELAELAAQNTGSRPLNSKYRKASEKFSALIIKYHDEVGLTWQDIADASGRTAIGIRMRATRHGHGDSVPPTVTPYRRVVIHPQKKSTAAKKKSAAAATKATKTTTTKKAKKSA